MKLLFCIHFSLSPCDQFFSEIPCSFGWKNIEHNKKITKMSYTLGLGAAELKEPEFLLEKLQKLPNLGVWYLSI
jgi:hypothetical protein